MSYTKERDEFISLATREGLSLEVTRKLLRYASTLQRLAVAQCNGDWPADNGERPVVFCGRCESGFVRSSFKRSRIGTLVCPDCRTSELVEDCLPEQFAPIVGGDPRGCVLKLKVPSGFTNDYGREGLCVPSREK